MSRLEFSRKTKAAIIARAGGKCEACEAALKPGEGDVDHILDEQLRRTPVPWWKRLRNMLGRV